MHAPHQLYLSQPIHDDLVPRVEAVAPQLGVVGVGLIVEVPKQCLQRRRAQRRHTDLHRTHTRETRTHDHARMHATLRGTALHAPPQAK
jgi:hypothetical protein